MCSRDKTILRIGIKLVIKMHSYQVYRKGKSLETFCLEVKKIIIDYHDEYTNLKQINIFDKGK